MIVNPKDVIAAGLLLLPRKMDSTAARVMMYAIGRQESRFLHRRQMGNGPATGFWQFERGGGVTGVLRHPSSAELARKACDEMHVAPRPLDVWRALQENDTLAAVFARLLLWTDANALPAPDPANHAEAWAYYLRNWRPGKPHHKTWQAFWREACAAYGVPA